MKYLVIVESPAKIAKISSYLNTIKQHTFIVEASYGHIYEFKGGLKAININQNFKASYQVIPSKLKIVNKLKSFLKKTDEVIIATDQDREGEAIGYHLIKELKLKIDKTKRISFNEISKKVIVDAFNNPGILDTDLYNAQQARSILDLLIGYNISPLLWKSIKPKISAGRCQSPALRLIYDRDKEIKLFKKESFYEIFGFFEIQVIDKIIEIKSKYFKDIQNKEQSITKLNKLINLNFNLQIQKDKISNISPPVPYITSSIQQDASIKFGYSPSTTMVNLQKLYESGKITYMRTDSIIISDEFADCCKNYIDKKYPNEYTLRKYKSKVANAQEAHECIRPVSLDIKIENIDNMIQKKLFDMIRKRTLACFMKDYKEKIYPVKLIEINKSKNITNQLEYFNVSFKKVLQLGYRKIYQIDISDDTNIIDNLINNVNYFPNKIEAIEKNSKSKNLYTEASLVKELENQGIGRPSTFSSIVNTLIDRKYVIKITQEKKKEINLNHIVIKKDFKIENKIKSSYEASLKGKLTITDLGLSVIEYMIKNFDNIIYYKFTSEINQKLDSVSNGNLIWYDLVNEVYNSFLPKINVLINEVNIPNYENKLFYTDNNIKYYYYRDKYGLCIIKEENNEMKKKRIENINLKEPDIEQLKELFKYPILLGKYNDQNIFLQKGPYGLYSEIDGIKLSIDNEQITINELIIKKQEKKNKIIKEWKSLQILNGPYGPYIKKKNKNYSLGDSVDIDNLTLKDCENIVKSYHRIPKKKKYNKD